MNKRPSIKSNLEINGPGKYDPLCTLVREMANARGAIVVILGGSRGFGFSAQLEPLLAAEVDLPKMLRDIADQMEGKR